MRRPCPCHSPLATYAETSRGVSARNVTRVAAASTTSQSGVSRQRPGQHGMRLPGESGDHLLRIRRVGRLRVDPTVEDDRRVDAQNRSPLGARSHGTRLPARMLTHELLGVRVRRVVLDVVGSHDVERHSELLENRPPLRRGRREQQRRRRRRTHRFRATQISSAGHRWPHATVTKS